MRIISLTLYNVRNFTYGQVIELSGDHNVFTAIAPNATGKTNFLEAIALVLRAKSFRSPNEAVVAWGEEFFRIVANIQQDDDTTNTVEIVYDANTKNIRIEENNLPVSPVQFYRTYPTVLYLPEDSFLFSRSPAIRRNFLNSALMIHPQYVSGVVQYQRTLKQRNAGLKTANNPQDIEPWTVLLDTHAATLWKYRALLIDFLQHTITDLFEYITGDRFDITITYEPHKGGDGSFLKNLRGGWGYEKRYQYTMYGPHRDDFHIHINNKPVASVFSRGQATALVLALKVGTAMYMRHVLGYDPVILFDEALSELDEEKQKKLIHSLPDMQIITTATQIPDDPDMRNDLHVLDIASIIDGEYTATEQVPVAEDTHKQENKEIPVQVGI